LSIDPDVATTNQPYAFTKDNPLNAEDPLGLGAKEKVGKIGICIVFFCNNGLAQVGTAWQPKASRGEAPTEQAVKEKNGTEERREAEEQTSGNRSRARVSSHGYLTTLAPLYKAACNPEQAR